MLLLARSAAIWKSNCEARGSGAFWDRSRADNRHLLKEIYHSCYNLTAVNQIKVNVDDHKEWNFLVDFDPSVENLGTFNLPLIDALVFNILY